MAKTEKGIRKAVIIVIAIYNLYLR